MGRICIYKIHILKGDDPMPGNNFGPNNEICFYSRI